MFGEFKSTLDTKGRMNFPAKLREQFGDSFMISKTIGADCIKIYTNEDWTALAASIKLLPQTKSASVQRFLFGSAYQVEPDKQGRISIPPPLRAYAALENELVILCLDGRAEIWSRENWDKVNEQLDSNNLAAIAEELGI